MPKNSDRTRDQDLTPKMHRFCLSIVEGDGASEAYRAAYATRSMSDESVAVEASRLLRDQRVRQRIDELRVSLQRSLGISRATLLRELDEVRDLAKVNGDVKTVLSATMGKARLLGFLDHPVKPISPSERDASRIFGPDLNGTAE
jgi:phage terminase small subunit